LFPAPSLAWFVGIINVTKRNTYHWLQAAATFTLPFDVVKTQLQSRLGEAILAGLQRVIVLFVVRVGGFGGNRKVDSLGFFLRSLSL
jgi:hypothetical protein